MRFKPIPVAVRSKAWVFGRSLARIVGSTADPSGRAVYGVGLRLSLTGIVGSNTAGGMDVCVVLDVWTIA